jgi:hypothetical protein
MRPQRFSVMVVVVVVVVVVISGLSCSTTDGGKGSNGEPKVSPFQQPCEAFCQHLRALGCKEGEPLRDGTSCETFCINTQEAGHNLHIPCILERQSCTELQKCR